MNATTEAPLLSILPDIGYKKIKNCAGGILSDIFPSQRDADRVTATFRRAMKGEENEIANLSELRDVLEDKRIEILDLLQDKSCIMKGREDDLGARRELAETILDEIEKKILDILAQKNHKTATEKTWVNIPLPKVKVLTLRQVNGGTIVLTRKGEKIEVTVENKNGGGVYTQYTCSHYDATSNGHSCYLAVYDKKGDDAVYGYTIEKPNIKV